MTKKEIRKIYRDKRLQLSHKEIEKFNDLILMQFQKIPFNSLNFVHTYLASDVMKEPDTSLILWYVAFRHPHVTVAAPRIDDLTVHMDHFVVNEDTVFSKNRFGIDEPAGGDEVPSGDFDLVLVPLLGFDTAGYRVGHGKGYYDHFLADCRTDAIKVGLSYFEPVDTVDDRTGFDIRLDYCCTPEALYSW